MVFRLLIACFVLGLLAHAVTGCDPVPKLTTSSQSGDNDEVLRRGNGGDPETLDPSLAEDVHAFNVLRDLYEGLVVDAADGSQVPGVAERWEISADGRRYTFHLRSDAVWSNGAAVIAEEFVAGIRRAVAPDSMSPYAFLLSPIANHAAVIDGTLPVTDLGIRAVDSRTLVIELAAPASHFLSVLAMPIALPLYGGGEFDPRRFRDPDRFVGNGPYILQEWVPGHPVRLKRNLRFRSAKDVSVQFVEYFPIENPDTELSMYRAGELDITATVPPAQLEVLRQRRPGELRISPALALYYLAFDLSEAPFDDLRLRRALSMAIDRGALVKLIGRGEQAAFGIVPGGVAGHQAARYGWQSATATERETEARRLYAAAGFDSATPLAFTLVYDAGDDVHETVALAVASMWHEVLGAQVTLDKREWQYFLATRNNRADWQVMRFMWFGDYNDANTFLDIFRSDSPQNLAGYRNSAYDDLLNTAARNIDKAARTMQLHQAEQQLLDAYPIAPLYFFVSKHLVDPAIRNFEMNILDIHPSRFLTKDISDETSVHSRPR